MFDIIAIMGGRVLFIQVKSNRSDVSTAKRKIKKWITENHLCLEVCIYLKENYKPPRVFIFGTEEWYEFDENSFEWTPENA